MPEFIDTPDRIWLPDCPDCGAPKGSPCLDPDGTPGCPHPDRLLAVADAMTEIGENDEDVRGRPES